MARLTIGGRLVIIVMLSGLAIIGSLGTSVILLKGSNATAAMLTATLKTTDDYAFKLLQDTDKVQGIVQTLLRERDVDIIEKLMATYDKAVQEVRAAATAFAKTDKDLLATIEDLLKADAAVVEVILRGDTTNGRQMFIEQVSPIVEKQAARIQTTRTAAAAAIAKQQSEFEASSGRLVLGTSLAGVLLAALIIFLGLFFARAIVKPLKLVVEGMSLLAVGDLSMEGFDSEGMRKVAARGDELGEVGRSVDALIASLTEVVTRISTSSFQVSAGSGQLSQTAQSISQGASEQAASIEELSASAEELSSTVRQNADSTAQADVLARRVTENADESGRSVRKMVESMQQIAGRISIIEEIARQTNLLALNAAIEAARAGESGKGFAVVASEVRKLAERSQIAAGEINELSRSSVAIAIDAGARLDLLLPDIKRTAEFIQEIAASSSEQASGADQISKSAIQMDSVVQQNASAAEELASSSEELSGQAMALRDAMSFFKIGGAAQL
ncbi:MAG: methyl-accepting chemotaxis protein [Treponemataceae bacterium]